MPSFHDRKFTDGDVPAPIALAALDAILGEDDGTAYLDVVAPYLGDNGHLLAITASGVVVEVDWKHDAGNPIWYLTSIKVTPSGGICERITIDERLFNPSVVGETAIEPHTVEVHRAGHAPLRLPLTRRLPLPELLGHLRSAYFPQVSRDPDGLERPTAD